MAGKPFHCKLITPEAHVLTEEIEYAQLPLWDGQAGILANRAPLMAKLGLGELRLDFHVRGGQGGSRSFLLEDGFAHMVDNTLTLLAERAIPVETLSEQEAQAELAEAQARSPQNDAERELVSRDRHRAEWKLKLAKKFRAAGGGI